MKGIIVAAVLIVGWQAVLGQDLRDDFNDNQTDFRRWATFTSGGPSIAEINQRVECYFPSDSHQDPQLGDFGAVYGYRCTFSGDYDVQVDYLLVGWPPANGVRLGLQANASIGVARVSFGSSTDYPGYPREVYLMGNPSVDGITPTTDTSGSLRLVRSGTVVTPYYYSSSGWVALPVATSSDPTTTFRLVAWSHDYAFTDQNVTLAYDNFVVNQGQLVVPSSIASLVVNQVGDDVLLSWDGIPGANAYDVVGGDLGALRSSGGNYSMAGCILNDTTATQAVFPSMPAPGQGEWFLLRPVNCGVNGTYNSEDAGQLANRDPLLAPPPGPCAYCCD